MLKDLGSSNGTYHNSIRVQEAELTAGDEVSVGPVVFTVVVDGRPAEIRPVRTVLDQTAEDAEDAEPDDAGVVDEPVEIADLAIDDDADLARELSDELASAGDLATPSVDEPPAAGLEDSDLDLGALDAAPAGGGESELDLEALFKEEDNSSAGSSVGLTAQSDDAAHPGPDKKRSSPPAAGAASESSILDFDFDDLDDI